MLKISKIFKCVFLYLLEHSYPRYFHVFGKFNIWVILGLEYVVSSLEKWSYFLDFFFFFLYQMIWIVSQTLWLYFVGSGSCIVLWKILALLSCRLKVAPPHLLWAVAQISLQFLKLGWAIRAPRGAQGRVHSYAELDPPYSSAPLGPFSDCIWPERGCL